MVSLPMEFSDKKVTPFGGMSLMKRFIDSLGIRGKLRELPLPQGGSKRAYDPVQGTMLVNPNDTAIDH